MATLAVVAVTVVEQVFVGTTAGPTVVLRQLRGALSVDSSKLLLEVALTSRSS